MRFRGSSAKILAKFLKQTDALKGLLSLLKITIEKKTSSKLSFKILTKLHKEMVPLKGLSALPVNLLRMNRPRIFDPEVTGT